VKYLPILIDIHNHDVLVVGGDQVAARKARGAHRAGARVTVLGTIESEAMAKAIKDDDYRHLDEEFDAKHLRGVRLVFAATDDMDLAKRVSLAAREAGIPVNVADKTALCSFIMPATVDREPVIVAISSGADAPILTRSLRAKLETLLPAGIGAAARFVAEHRKRVIDTLPDFDQRRRFWDRFMDGPVPELISDGDLETAETLFADILDKFAEDETAQTQGDVVVIGCGPGDPDMLTFKALRHMQQADVVLATPDVSESIRARARRDAEFINADFSIDDVVGWVNEGKTVVRLGPRNFPATDQAAREIEEMAGRKLRTVTVSGIQ